MHRVFATLLRRRIAVLVSFLILFSAALLVLPLVRINYDLAEYLPADAPSRQAIAILQSEFDYPGQAEVLLPDVSVAEAGLLKQRLTAVSGVESVIWLDDLADLAQPLNFIDPDALDQYYRGRQARLQVFFATSDYAPATGAALDQIRQLLGTKGIVVGSAVDGQQMRGLVSSEITTVILVVVPVIILLLSLTSASWIEPLIFLLVMGVSIVINLGSNIFFQNISFLTHATAAVLQLAISMDYALFLAHRYHEERASGLAARESIVKAARTSLSSIAASCLTTVAGFLALVFMRYGIGRDIGFVLAKGVVISLLSVMLLMPALFDVFARLIDRTAHRRVIPSFKAWGRFLMRRRLPVVALILVILVLAFLAQGKVSYLYGDTSGSSASSQLAADRTQMEQAFGLNNPVVLLVPSGQIAREMELAELLDDLPAVGRVQALVTLADPAISRLMLPQAVLDQFDSGTHSRMIIQLNVRDESPALFAGVADLQTAAEKVYPGSWLMAGTATGVADIRATVLQDSGTVSLVSLLAVGLILLFTFRSLLLPVLLVAVIQSSIWINVGIAYFQGSSLVFIGYLIVSSLQLGATIDYAILLTQRYLDFRQLQHSRDAARSAIGAAGPSVMISALILSTAGFALGFLSKIRSVSDIGLLIGRGALSSGLLVLILLPVLLQLLDPLIRRTTLGGRRLLRAAPAIPDIPKRSVTKGVENI